MRKTVVLVLVIAMVCVYAMPVIAEEKAKDLAEYSGNVVTGTANTVGKATEGTAKTAVSPIVAFWNAITGKGTPEKIITDPVNEGGKTVYDASINTGKTVTGQK